MRQSRTSASTRRSYSEAVRALAQAQKSGSGVPAYLRWVNRGLGRRAAAVAFVLGWTPNGVTLLSGLVSLAGIVVVALAGTSWPGAAAGAFLLLAGYALDSADGQLARLTGTGSPAGEWLDHVVDSARLPLVHLGIAVALYQHGGASARWPVLVALLFGVLTSSWFFAQILATSLGDVLNRSAVAEQPAWVSFAKIPYDVGSLYVLVVLLAAPPVFTVAYVALFCFTVAVAAGSLRRKYLGLRDLVTT